MKYKTEDLEKMTKEDLIETYRNARNSVKKDILVNLANSRKFAILMNSMYPQELEQMAKIHPYKEVVVDAMIHEMESHGTNMARYFNGNSFQRESFDKFMGALQHKSFFARIKETFSKKPALPESLPKKIEQAKKLCEIEERRKNATGKKMENSEKQELDKPSDESRVELQSGEMTRVFERVAREKYEKGKTFAVGSKETEVGKELLDDLSNEYKTILENEDVAKLIANAEFENRSGKFLSVPYRGEFASQTYDPKGQGINGWQKNLLEVEQVKDFTVQDKNLGEVFIVKSEFTPTSYAIKDKWAPVYEYYTKNENGELTRIGAGKINDKTGEMETTISTNGKDIFEDIKAGEFGKEKIENGKNEGTIIQFNSNEYTGTSTKTARKDVEQAITTKAIQEHLGKGKKIADITQIKDIPVEDKDENGNPKKLNKNAYMVASVENGIESYEMVCMTEDGKCEAYPGMTQDMFAKKDIFFPTGMSTGYDKRTSLDVIDKKQALQTFKSRDGSQFSAYRDEEGNLRVAQLMDHASGNGKYAEELDTYTVMHGDIEKIKAQSKEEYDRALTVLKAKEAEKSTSLRIGSKEDDTLSL